MHFEKMILGAQLLFPKNLFDALQRPVEVCLDY